LYTTPKRHSFQKVVGEIHSIPFILAFKIIFPQFDLSSSVEVGYESVMISDPNGVKSFGSFWQQLASQLTKGSL
jgi:hypothetical protein